MAILRLKDADGNVIAIPAIKGDTPVKGVDYCTEDEMVELVATLDDGSTVTYQMYGQAVTK